MENTSKVCEEKKIDKKASRNKYFPSTIKSNPSMQQHVMMRKLVYSRCSAQSVLHFVAWTERKSIGFYHWSFAIFLLFLFVLCLFLWPPFTLRSALNQKSGTYNDFSWNFMKIHYLPSPPFDPFSAPIPQSWTLIYRGKTIVGVTSGAICTPSRLITMQINNKSYYTYCLNEQQQQKMELYTRKISWIHIHTNI